jgi:hypothetical protein
MAELGILGKLGRAHRMSVSSESAKTLYSEAAEEIMRLRQIEADQLAQLRIWHPAYIADTGSASTATSENSGHGPWCHHEGCRHWFEPQCGTACESRETE